MSFLVSASLEEYHRTEKLESGPRSDPVHEILTKYEWRSKVDIQKDKRHMEEENEIFDDELLEYGTAAEIDDIIMMIKLCL